MSQNSVQCSCRIVYDILAELYSVLEENSSLVPSSHWVVHNCLKLFSGLCGLLHKCGTNMHAWTHTHTIKNKINMFKLYFLIGLSIDSVNGRDPEMMKNHLINKGDSQESDRSCGLLYGAKCNCMPLTTISFVWFSKSHKEERARYTVPLFFFRGRINMITVDWIIQETGGWLESGYKCSIKVLSGIQRRNNPSGRL